MSTWTEDQLAIINALQEATQDAKKEADEAKKTATEAEDKAARASAVAKVSDAKATEVAEEEAKNSALDDSRYAELTAKVEDAEQKATEAKAIAEKALTEAAEYESKSNERYQQTQKTIEHLTSLIEDNKDCCESNMKAIERLTQSIKILEKFVSSINDHTHDDDLMAGDKLLANVKRKRAEASDANNKKETRRMQTTQFFIEGDGKLGKLVTAIEDWLTPFLHKHDMSEAIEEAAKSAVEEKAAYENNKNLS